MAHDELIQRCAARDEHGGRSSAPTPRPPGPLPRRGNRPRIAGHHADVERPDVDTELQRIGRDDGAHDPVSVGIIGKAHVGALGGDDDQRVRALVRQDVRDARLASARCADGGYPLLFAQTTCESEVEPTAMAVQALIAVGRHADAAVQDAASAPSALASPAASEPLPLLSPHE